MEDLLKIIAGVVVAIIVVVIICCVLFGGDSRVNNDKAEQDEDGRYITIINETDQVINEVHIMIGEGTEIEAMRQTNPDETSFSIEVPDEYSEYTTFVVVLVDRYDLKYVKEIADVKSKGRTEVVISENDYVKEKGDFGGIIDKFFNGD